MAVTTNCVGLGMQLFYLGHFYIFGEYKNMIISILLFYVSIKKIKITVVLVLIYIEVIAAITLTEFETNEKRSTFVGAFCIAFGIVTLIYAQPSTVVIKITVVLVLELIYIIEVIAAITLTEFKTYEKRSTFVGVFCVAFGIVALIYAQPPTVVIVNGTGAI
ncbi:hypothetical protein QQ045_007351 [Rhodiola kirilowii]